MAKEPEIIHSCDGIEEYNNPLPSWWLTMFYGTIVFAIVYQILFPSWFGPGLLKWSQITRYDNEVKAAAEQTAKVASAQSTAGGLQAVIADPKAIEAGKALFTQNCAACHGANAEGAIGPNLHQPPYWAYGKGAPEDIQFIITHGTNGTAGLNKESKGGMPTWSQLGSTKIQQLTAFVYSLQGK
ncbi:MAG TPA: cbb3-type cytochrome c oxidase N-terminal domain-containing protein [Stenomitos sp.]